MPRYFALPSPLSLRSPFGLTWDASIGNFEVRGQVFGTGSNPCHGNVRNWNPTRRSSGTLLVCIFHDVLTAANLSVRLLDAATHAHAPIPRSCHHDDLVLSTRSVKRFPLAVLGGMTFVEEKIEKWPLEEKVMARYHSYKRLNLQ